MSVWWKNGIVYQIYPRSFQDSNGDGIGDLEGIIQRLDHLNGKNYSLGIDAIWLSPIYPSPNYDFGYDISDYKSIDPIYGDLKTFQSLLKQAHKRKIHIILDLVMNHTSHLHPWFLESRSSRNSPYRNYYLWEDPKNGKQPNNWLSVFGGEGWTWDENTKQYYFHSFLKEQPDLNWRNPKVREEMYSIMKFWLDMGVDGFRLDVANCFIKDRLLRNNPSKFLKGLRSYDRQIHYFDRDRVELHEIFKEIRTILDSYDNRMCVGEIMQDLPGNVFVPAEYYGNHDELNLAFNFSFLFSSWNAKSFFRIIDEFEKALGPNQQPNYTLSNHDFPRHISRYSKDGHTIPRAKLAAMLLLTLRGTPFLYYGEEIGMTREWVARKEMKDPVGKKYWPIFPGRDPERLPMCWDQSIGYGFSESKPWLPYHSKSSEINVKNQIKDSESLFNVYRNLIEIRRTHESLQIGAMECILLSDDEVIGIRRHTKEESIYIFMNFSSKSKVFQVPQIWKLKEVLYSTIDLESEEVGKTVLSLKGDQGIIFLGEI
jgi:alpha-glucosidase